jgi:hypothetical protein
LAAFGAPTARDFDPNRHSIYQDEDDAREQARRDREAALQDALQHQRRGSAASQGLYVHHPHDQVQNRMEDISAAGRLHVQEQLEMMLEENEGDGQALLPPLQAPHHPETAVLPMVVEAPGHEAAPEPPTLPPDIDVDTDDDDMDDEDRFFDALEAAWIEREEEEWHNALWEAGEEMFNDLDEEWFEAHEEEFNEALEQQAREMDQSHILIDDMIENIVSGRTRRIYYDDTLHFIQWCIDNRPAWVTDYCKEQLAIVNESVHGMRTRQRNRCIKARFKALLRNAQTAPLVHLDLIQARDFMTYLDHVRNQRTGRRLSRSAYGNRRAALNDLFRWHGHNSGCPEEFNKELTPLFRGFLRIIAQDDGEGGVNVKEGKEPMSIELYRLLCSIFLDMGTDEGIWAYCFLVLTWNLMCRGNNTTRICWNQIFWISSDSLEIHFAHHKGDQLGEKRKYPRHIYANPLDYLVCPIFALSLYLLTFNVIPLSEGRVFPGNRQYKRFGDLLRVVLRNNADAVRHCGHDPKDIGVHSIRKGAATYASSQPGGPPAAAICVRAGWTMGNVQDIYIKWERGGDQFVGRCLALLPLLKAEFGVSQPHFAPELPRPWIRETAAATYAMVSSLLSQTRLVEMCLAQLIYHRAVITQWDTNHVIRMNCQLFRNPSLMEDAIAHTRVIHPWDQTAAQFGFTGIPPHVAVLHQLRGIAVNQRNLVNEFLDGMTE